MRILFVIGSCLRVNTSANLCHIAYIKGCIDNGYEVNVVSVGEKGYIIDGSISLPKTKRWITFEAPTFRNAIKAITSSSVLPLNNKGKGLINILKEKILGFYGIYGRSASIWIKRAKKFKDTKEYDYVISLATPYVSHHLANLLIKSGNIKCKSWIQIWEDPWNADLYNREKDKRKLNEEKHLLKAADKIIYVSPLTLEYQKRYFSESSVKMSWHTLPYYYKKEQKVRKNNSEKIFGYYGDYYSFSRNLQPFYCAAIEIDARVNIYGNSDYSLKQVGNICIKPRVSLSELEEVEGITDVFVFLCNLGGGQIPGKLYQYSATDREILFILDGTEYEKKIIKNYFSKFNRYFFCENDVDSIKESMIKICRGKIQEVSNKCIEAFSPENTIRNILNQSSNLEL